MHANICILRKYTTLSLRAVNLPPPAISLPFLLFVPLLPSLVQIPSFSLPALLCLVALRFFIIYRFSFLNAQLLFLTFPYNFLPSPFCLSLGWHILTPSQWLLRLLKSCSQVSDSLWGQKKTLGKSVARCNDYGSVWTRLTPVFMVPDEIQTVGKMQHHWLSTFSLFGIFPGVR